MELWELIARESIRDCIARYNANGDSGRIDEMVAVFAPDAVMETGGRVFRGRDEIHGFFSGVAAQTRRSGDAPAASTPTTPAEEWVARGRTPFIRHFTATTQIDLESEQRARARSYYLVISVGGLDHWGRYLDEYGVVDGRWLITKRTEITDAVFAGGWGAGGGAEVAELLTRPLTGGRTG
jgi:hypothetical protein